MFVVGGEKMQIKKEDLKNDIIEAAKVEFCIMATKGLQ